MEKWFWKNQPVRLENQQMSNYLVSVSSSFWFPSRKLGHTNRAIIVAHGSFSTHPLWMRRIYAWARVKFREYQIFHAHYARGMCCIQCDCHIHTQSFQCIRHSIRRTLVHYFFYHTRFGCKILSTSNAYTLNNVYFSMPIYASIYLCMHFYANYCRLLHTLQSHRHIVSTLELYIKRDKKTHIFDELRGIMARNIIHADFISTQLVIGFAISSNVRMLYFILFFIYFTFNLTQTICCSPCTLAAQYSSYQKPNRDKTKLILSNNN